MAELKKIVDETLPIINDLRAHIDNGVLYRFYKDKKGGFSILEKLEDVCNLYLNLNVSIKIRIYFIDNNKQYRDGIFSRIWQNKKLTFVLLTENETEAARYRFCEEIDEKKLEDKLINKKYINYIELLNRLGLVDKIDNATVTKKTKPKNQNNKK